MITNPEIEKYIYGLLPPRDEVLAEMEAQAAERKIPIVGPAVGSLLAALVRATGAKRIFELGSAIGYSTILAGACGRRRCRGALFRRRSAECRGGAGTSSGPAFFQNSYSCWGRYRLSGVPSWSI